MSLAITKDELYSIICQNCTNQRRHHFLTAINLDGWPIKIGGKDEVCPTLTRTDDGFLTTFTPSSHE